jgi:hypothetical protein
MTSYDSLMTAYRMAAPRIQLPLSLPLALSGYTSMRAGLVMSARKQSRNTRGASNGLGLSLLVLLALLIVPGLLLAADANFVDGLVTPSASVNDEISHRRGL